MKNEFYSEMLASVMTEKQLSGYKESVSVLISAKETGQIYNADYNDVKDKIGRLISNCFDLVLEKYSGKGFEDYAALSEEEKDLKDKYIGSAHDIISAYKKVKKVSVDSEYVEKYKLLCSELIETAEFLKELKGKTIKGRKPSEKIAKINENKIIKTCPCCFRNIAVNESGRIVHHGFRRLGGGTQTESCFGYNFLSWEESPEGLIAYLDVLQKELKKDRESLKKHITGEIKELIDLTRTEYGHELLKISEEDPNFKEEMKHRILKLERNVSGLEKSIAQFEKILKERK